MRKCGTVAGKELNNENTLKFWVKITQDTLELNGNSHRASYCDIISLCPFEPPTTQDTLQLISAK